MLLAKHLETTLVWPQLVVNEEDKVNALIVILLTIILFFLTLIVNKEKPKKRVAVFILFIVSLIVGAYILGEFRMRVSYVSVHIRCFDVYSSVLASYANAGKYKELSDVVIEFDREWKKNMQHTENISKLVNKLEKQYREQSRIRGDWGHGPND